MCALMCAQLDPCGNPLQVFSFLHVALPSPNSDLNTRVSMVSWNTEPTSSVRGVHWSLPAISSSHRGLESLPRQLAEAMQGETHLFLSLRDCFLSFAYVHCLESICSICFQFSDGKFLKFLFIYLSQK